MHPAIAGQEARGIEVVGLAPTDDLPPQTIITHVAKQDGKLLVRGTTADNGTVTTSFVFCITRRTQRCSKSMSRQERRRRSPRRKPVSIATTKSGFM